MKQNENDVSSDVSEMDDSVKDEEYVTENEGTEVETDGDSESAWKSKSKSHQYKNKIRNERIEKVERGYDRSDVSEMDDSVKDEDYVPEN